jgi:hypothetical protein
MNKKIKGIAISIIICCIAKNIKGDTDFDLPEFSRLHVYNYSGKKIKLEFTGLGLSFDKKYQNIGSKWKSAAAKAANVGYIVGYVMPFGTGILPFLIPSLIPIPQIGSTTLRFSYDKDPNIFESKIIKNPIRIAFFRNGLYAASSLPKDTKTKQATLYKYIPNNILQKYKNIDINKILNSIFRPLKTQPQNKNLDTAYRVASIIVNNALEKNKPVDPKLVNLIKKIANNQAKKPGLIKQLNVLIDKEYSNK